MYLAAAAILAALLATERAQSQAWPQQPVSIVVPFAPGGNPDGIARLVTQSLSRVFGEEFIVENRPGAGGVAASAAVRARRPADGYTLLMASPAQIAIAPAMGKTPYDPTKDFAPISAVATHPYFWPSIRACRSTRGRARGLCPPTTHALLCRPGLRRHQPSRDGVFPQARRAGDDPGRLRGRPPRRWSASWRSRPVYLAPCRTSCRGQRAPHPAARRLERQARGAIRRRADLRRGGFSPELTILAGTVSWRRPERRTRSSGGSRRRYRAPSRTPNIGLARYGAEPLANTPAEFTAMIAADVAFWGEAVRTAGVLDK